MNGRAPARRSGFTLIELLVTLSLVGVVAMVALPLAEVALVRQKESELRQRLQTLRSALDAYKAAVDAGDIARATGASGYPPSLEVLFDGVDMVRKPTVTAPVSAPVSAPVPAPTPTRAADWSVAAAAPATAASAAGDAAAKRLYFLRQVPRDPFCADEDIPASQTWAPRSYASRPDDPQPGADVFDVASRSSRQALNGSRYSTW